jgi:hypothetical protein
MSTVLVAIIKESSASILLARKAKNSLLAGLADFS